MICAVIGENRNALSFTNKIMQELRILISVNQIKTIDYIYVSPFPILTWLKSSKIKLTNLTRPEDWKK